MDLSSRFSKATVDSAIAAALLRDCPSHEQQAQQFQEAFESTHLPTPHAFGAPVDGHFGGQSDFNLCKDSRAQFDDDCQKQERIQQMQSKMLSPSEYDLPPEGPPVGFGLPLENLPMKNRKFVNIAHNQARQHYLQEGRPSGDKSHSYVATGPLATIQTSAGQWDPVVVPICTHHQGMSADSHEKIQQIETKLRKNLGPEFISERKGPGGKSLSYLEGWKAVDLANEIFGYSGWASRIMAMNVDYVMPPRRIKAAEGDINSTDDHWKVGVHCIMRITLRDGSFHEDVGFAEGNSSYRVDAYENSYKSASTDALKRALKHFGRAVGLCLNDDDYRQWVGKFRKEEGKLRPPPFEPSELLRDPSRRPVKEPPPSKMEISETKASTTSTSEPGPSNAVTSSGPSITRSATLPQPAALKVPPTSNYGAITPDDAKPVPAGPRTAAASPIPGALNKAVPAVQAKTALSAQTASIPAPVAVVIAGPVECATAAPIKLARTATAAPPQPARATDIAPSRGAMQAPSTVARSVPMSAPSARPTTMESFASIDEDEAMAACEAAEAHIAEKADVKPVAQAITEEAAPPSTPWDDTGDDELDMAMEVACEEEERKTSSGSSAAVAEISVASATAGFQRKHGAADDSGIGMADNSCSVSIPNVSTSGPRLRPQAPPRPPQGPPQLPAQRQQHKPIGGFTSRGSVSSLAAIAAAGSLTGGRSPLQRSNTSMPSASDKRSTAGGQSRSVSPTRPPGGPNRSFSTAASLLGSHRSGAGSSVQGRSVNHGYVAGGAGDAGHVGTSSTPLQRGVKRTINGQASEAAPAGVQQEQSGGEPSKQHRQPLSPLKIDERGAVKRPRN